jgi:diketogulonate reductase-like aldo/keto reductase
MTHTIQFPASAFDDDAASLPAIGIGTWYLGDNPSAREEEIRAVRAGLDAGLRVIDTAEMYGGGRSERLVGEAIAGRREEVFLVSKVLPSNASARGTAEALERSLDRLGTDYLDLYLLHWRGGVPLGESVEALHELKRAGAIRAWGVSNLDPEDLADLDREAGPLAAELATDQVLYNPTRRGPEVDLFPELERRGVPAMAYSPVEQGRLIGEEGLERVARRLGATPVQVALAWAIRNGSVLAIPKASTVEHAVQNAAALDLELGEEDLAELDAAFPRPSGPVPLEIL